MEMRGKQGEAADVLRMAKKSGIRVQAQGVDVRILGPSVDETTRCGRFAGCGRGNAGDMTTGSGPQIRFSGSEP